MPLESLFEITRFASFLEALVENPDYRKSLQRPLEILIEAEKVPLIVKDWVAFWDEGPRLEGISLSPESWKKLNDFRVEELLVIERWLLDRVIREYGSGARKKGHKNALELLVILMHELARDTAPNTLIALLEQYLPMTQDPAMASDLYQGLFSCSFNPEGPGLETYLLAVQGLEKAKISGDSDRIGASAYNLSTYHSFFDAELAESILDEYLEHLQDERYYDALGNIALKFLEDQKSERGRSYLQSVWMYTLKFSSREDLSELQSIAFNLAYYALNLAWSYYEDRDHRRSIQVLRRLHKILVRERHGFLASAKDLGGHPIDWTYQYYVHVAECYLWLYANHEELDEEDKAQTLLAEFQNYRMSCPYDLEPMAKEFFQERGKGD